MRLPKPISKFLSFLVALVRLPGKASRKLHEALEDWSEMAPYRIRLMSQSFGDMSATGLSTLKKPQGPFDPGRYRDEFTRQEMIIWRFLDYDRMIFGKHDPITARQWISLGDLYWKHRRPGDARVFYSRGLKIFKMACEKTDDRLIAAQKKMADCYLLCGAYGEAEVLLKEIAEGLEAKPVKVETANAGNAPKPKGFDNATAERIANLLALAETYKHQKKFVETTETLQKVVDIHEAVGLPTGDDCLAVYRELASAYSTLGDEKNAELFAATAKQLDFMLIVEKAVGAEARTMIRELEPLAELYRKRQKTVIVNSLKRRIEICELVAKVASGNYPGVEIDLERLARHYDERNIAGDATVAFRLRARAKRYLEEMASRTTVGLMLIAAKVSWFLEVIEGSEAFIASLLSSLASLF